MTTSPLPLERIPVLTTVDVLVVGGGSAGCCAALAAREAGTATVLLIERYGFLGGTSTQMLDTFYGFFTLGETPRKVVGGTPGRVVDALDAAGAVFLRPNTCGAGTPPCRPTCAPAAPGWKHRRAPLPPPATTGARTPTELT